MIFLDSLSRIDSVIQSRSYSKYFHKDEVGKMCLFALDESKRLLAVCATSRVGPFLYLTPLAHETEIL